MTEFSVITYNVAGLPQTLDLNDLPFILKPVAWIYKLIKGTTLVTINEQVIDRDNINNYLSKSGCDIIGVQEDFSNQQATGYSKGTDKGGFNLKKLFSSITWFPPRFKADGINIFYNNRIKVNSEKIVWWKKSNGYFNHANDKLTHKGFRYYNLTIDNCDLDLYIVHMDADFYHPDKCPDISKDIEARRSQLNQLSDFIVKRYSENPILIIGDTNLSDYQWDNDLLDSFREKLIQYNFLPRITTPTHIVDKVIIVDNPNSTIMLDCVEVEVQSNITFTDHRPVKAILKTTYKR